MRTAVISSGGQVSVPAEVRHRWGVTRVLVEDAGDALVIRPLPEDPIAAARGSLRARGTTAERARARVRSEEGRRERGRARTR